MLFIKKKKQTRLYRELMIDLYKFKKKIVDGIWLLALLKIPHYIRIINVILKNLK